MILPIPGVKSFNVTKMSGSGFELMSGFTEHNCIKSINCDFPIMSHWDRAIGCNSSNGHVWVRSGWDGSDTTEPVVD